MRERVEYTQGFALLVLDGDRCDVVGPAGELREHGSRSVCERWLRSYGCKPIPEAKAGDKPMAAK